MNTRWFLLGGDRWIVAGIILTGVFLTLLLLGWIDVIGVRMTGPMSLLFDILNMRNLTPITIAFSMNQLLLLWELSSFHDIRRYRTAIQEFRTEVSDAADIAVNSAEPTAFLRVLLRVVQDRAEALNEIAIGTDTDFEGRIRR